MKRRKVVLVRESRTLGEKVTFELDLEELIKVWGGFAREWPFWQSKLILFRIQACSSWWRLRVMGSWGEVWHQMTVGS